jgi:hypothetical protein
VRRDARDFLLQLGEFLLDVHAVARALRAVVGLHGQFAHAVDHVRDALHPGVLGLDEGDDVFHVQGRHRGVLDLRAETLGNSQPRGVVARRTMRMPEDRRSMAFFRWETLNE